MILLSTLGTGKIANLMVKEGLTIRMVTITKAPFNVDLEMDMVSSSLTKFSDTRESGRIQYFKETAKYTEMDNYSLKGSSRMD